MERRNEVGVFRTVRTLFGCLVEERVGINTTDAFFSVEKGSGLGTGDISGGLGEFPEHYLVKDSRIGCIWCLIFFSNVLSGFIRHVGNLLCFILGHILRLVLLCRL